SVLRCTQRSMAVFAHIEAGSADVVIAARLAAIGVLSIDSADAPGAHRNLDALDLVAGAFVVNDCAGAEFANRQEPWTLQVVAAGPVADSCPHSRDVGRQRQPGEAVSGQKSLAGE